MTSAPERPARRRKLRVLLGRRWVDPRELTDLDVGSVIDLAAPVEDDVVVYADGRRRASGKAILLDGKLAVRITDVTRRPDEPPSPETK